MTTESEMKINYAVVLKQLQEELNGLDDRRQALLASVAAMRQLVGDDEVPDILAPGRARDAYLTAPEPPVKMPVVPPGFFSGKTPTEAYRELMRVWPGHYRPPQIADLFLQGGMEATSRTGLVQAIHSVLKRARKAPHRQR